MYKRILASVVVSVFAVAMAVAQSSSSSSSGSYPSNQSSSGQSSAQPSSPSSPNAGQMPQSDVNATANATRELQVSKVEMVSDTCSIKSSNNNPGTGNTTPPPQK